MSGLVKDALCIIALVLVGMFLVVYKFIRIFNFKKGIK